MDKVTIDLPERKSHKCVCVAQVLDYMTFPPFGTIVEALLLKKKDHGVTSNKFCF